VRVPESEAGEGAAEGRGGREGKGGERGYAATVGARAAVVPAGEEATEVLGKTKGLRKIALKQQQSPEVKQLPVEVYRSRAQQTRL
jgi:hypothetical protein